MPITKNAMPSSARATRHPPVAEPTSANSTPAPARHTTPKRIEIPWTLVASSRKTSRAKASQQPPSTSGTHQTSCASPGRSRPAHSAGNACVSLTRASVLRDHRSAYRRPDDHVDEDSDERQQDDDDRPAGL